MARTTKWEHRTDGYHIGIRLERQARSAGRLVAVVEAELALDEEDDDEYAMCYVPAPTPEEEARDEREMYGYWHPTSPCGGWCRRCLLHDDPGGCLG